MLILRDITKSYLNSSENDEEVLKGINWEIKPGQTAALLGPSGSGKTTLLNIMGTLDTPTSGEVLWQDKNLRALGEKELSLFRNHSIGFIFQQHYLLNQCTVLENILIPTLARPERKEKRNFLRDRAQTLLAQAGMEKFGDYRPAQLSGGQRQRVAVIRALINQPGLLLADEPTGSLDRETAENLIDMLLELNRREGTALVIATHYLPVAEKVDQAFELKAGKILQKSNK